jgi:hypothetical protein
MERTLRARNLSDVGGFVFSLVLVALALLGMTGLIYHTLTPDGLVGLWLARLWASHPVSTTLVLVGLVAMVLTARSQATFRRRASGNGDRPLYVFVAIGTFFAVKWIMSGML